MPILIDQLNINARVVAPEANNKPASQTKNNTPAASNPKVIIELLQRAIDAKRW